MTEAQTAPRTIQLVTVSADYPASQRPTPGGSDWQGDDVFFAFPNGEEWTTLVVPDSDPRSRGMWNAESDIRVAGLSDALDSTVTYRGWSVERRYITVIPEETPEVTESPREVDNASQLRKGDAFRITNGYGDTTQYIVTGDPLDNGDIPITWQSGPRRGLNWGGATVTPPVPVALIPEGEWSEFTRENVTAALPVVETPEVPADETPEESVTLTASELAERLAQAKASGKREAEAVFESWKESANRTAIAYANDNSLCSEFDRCMRDIGMLDRDQHREEFPDEYEREYSVTVTYSLTVSAMDDESAVENAQGIIDAYTIRSYGDWEAEESY